VVGASCYSSTQSKVLYYSSAQSNCAEQIGVAQGCTKQCVDAPYTMGTDYSYMLLYCLDQDAGTSRAQQLETCCGMTGPCITSMVNAHECLNTELADVKSTALDYLTCVYERKQDGTCMFADWCVPLLTGGSGTGETNDFSLSGGSSLALLTSEAQTCSALDVFGKNACETVEGCCGPCSDKIAAVVNAVTNDILLPTYGNGNITQCDDKTCDEFTGAPTRRQRQVEATAIDTDATDTTIVIDAAKMTEIVSLAEECNEALSIDIASYNQTHAAAQYIPCLYKNMNKLLAEPETTAESSSSAVAFFSGATSVSVAAIASTVFAALA